MIQRKLVVPQKLSFFLFGPRQTGKSCLLDAVFIDRVWKIDLLLNDVFQEYIKAPEVFRREAIAKIDSKSVDTIIVDEVQRVPQILTEIHFLMGRYPDIRFVLTGSSARKLRRGGTDMLAGRAVECRLFPFTREELGSRFNLDSVLQFGSLPSLTGRDDEEKQQILRAYVQTYLREEIKAEGIARNLGGFSRFLDVAASQCGEILNVNAVARDCRLPQRTVESYYEILEDTLIGFRLEPWRASVRKRLTAHHKFYLFDTGVTNAINRRLTAGLDPAVRGRLFEQFIICEVHRALAYANSEARLFYWRTNNGAEVDLAIEKHGAIAAAIEIKSGSTVAGADCTGLRSFHEDHPETPCFVVCTARNRYGLNGITVLPWEELADMLKEWW
jgi:uncharacterized protein